MSIIMKVSYMKSNNCSYCKSGPLISKYFLTCKELQRWIFRFIDTGGLINHHCINFLFIKNNNETSYNGLIATGLLKITVTFWLVSVRDMVLNTIFNNISVISWRLVLLVRWNRSTNRKPSTCPIKLTNFITQCCRVYFTWDGFELTS